MAERAGFSVADVRRAYSASKRSEEVRGEWAAWLLYRQISFLITPWFLAAPVSATAVTVCSLLIALCLPLLAVSGSEWSWVWVSLAAVLVLTLDCVDGNIARVTHSVSRIGHYADFMTDILYRIAFYFSIGLLIARGAAADSVLARHAPALAALAALLAVTARLGRVYLESREPPAVSAAPAPAESAPPAGGVYAAVFSFVSGIDSLLPLLVLAAGAAGHLRLVLLWILAYSALDFVHTQVSVLLRLR